MPIRLTTYQKFQRQTMLKSLAVAQTGAMATLRRLQDAGLPMRKTDLLRQYREYSKIPGREDLLKYVRKDFRPSKAVFTEQEGFMTRRYRYRVKYQTRDKRTGEIADFYTSVISDTPLTPRQAELEAQGAIRKTVDLSPITLLRLNVAIAEHRKGDAWDF